MFNIYSFVEKTGVDSVLLLTANGDLVRSENVEFAENFAAMTGSIAIMCNEMLEDLNVNPVKQIIIKSDNHLIVGCALPEELFVFVFTTELSKLGLIMKILESSAIPLSVNF